MRNTLRRTPGHTVASLLALLVLVAVGCARPGGGSKQASPFADPLSPIPQPRTAADWIVNGAKAEVRHGVLYDASYRTLAYPGGDVAADRGACTDVIVRALRCAGYDLQQLIYEDMRRHFGLYPRRYGLQRPDPNIDHRRTPNHTVFFSRYGLALPIETSGAAAGTWEPGDLVYCRLENGNGHCGVLSDVRGDSGLPLVIHNMGRTCQEDCLPRWQITHHFRYPRTSVPRRAARSPRVRT